MPGIVIVEMPHALASFILVLMLSNVAHAQQPPETFNTEPRNELSQKAGEFEKDIDEKLFKKLFMRRRSDHLEAVKSLHKMDSYERLYKVVSVIFEKLFEVIEYSKTILDDVRFVLNDSPFPKNATVKDALSNILENTALFGDIVLHFPDITQRILKTQSRWNGTILWSLGFVNQAKNLLDASTTAMIHLMSQELNITTRDPDYFNPYWSVPLGQKIKEGNTKKRTSSKKEKRKKGPQIIKIEL